MHSGAAGERDDIANNGESSETRRDGCRHLARVERDPDQQHCEYRRYHVPVVPYAIPSE